MKLEKCLFCLENKLNSSSLRRRIYCISEKCLPYKVFYSFNNDNNQFDMICFDIIYNDIKYNIDYIDNNLFIYNDNINIEINLINPYEIIITPFNFQNKLPTILTFQ